MGLLVCEKGRGDCDVPPPCSVDQAAASVDSTTAGRTRGIWWWSTGWATGDTAGLAPKRGIHSSQLGMYQFHSPRSFMLAGSRTTRTIVASSSTATASPMPVSFIDTEDKLAKMRKTITMTVAAAVTVAAVDLMPLLTARSVDWPARWFSRILLKMNTW